MTFAPYLCSTPKFVSVLNQPSHFILAAPLEEKVRQQRQSLTSHCRPLKKCHRYHSKQSNASTAINRQHQFDNDTTLPNNQQQIFFCLPLKIFSRTKQRRRHRPCHV